MIYNDNIDKDRYIESSIAFVLKIHEGDCAMKTTKKCLAVVVALIAALAAFAANAFASSPCIGALCEPEVPEELRK